MDRTLLQRLGVAATTAVLLHLTAVSLGMVYLDAQHGTAPPQTPQPQHEPKPEPENKTEPEPTLGKTTASQKLTVAWIDADAFEALQARRSTTHQPALQNEADPTPDAPLRPDASPPKTSAAPPASATAPPATPAPPTPMPSIAVTTPLPQKTPPAEPEATTTPTPPASSTTPAITPTPTAPAPAPPLDATGTPTFADADTQADITGDADTQVNTDADTPARATAVAAAAPAVADVPASPLRAVNTALPNKPPPSATPQPDTPADAAPATDVPPNTPTATPRDDAESDPTTPTDTPVVRPGKVQVGPGLEVTVARPRFAAVALVSTIPRSPKVAITFDTDGTVINAVITRSTGAENFDAPILASLYRWKAQGEELARWKHPRTFTFTILLHDP